MKELGKILKENEAMLKTEPAHPKFYADGTARPSTILDNSRGLREPQSIEELGTAFVHYTLRSFTVPGRCEESLREHRELVAALEARSPRVAEAAMRKHIRGEREYVILAKRLQMV